MLRKKIKLSKNLGYYFPLFNLKGMSSSITPHLGGDLKLDHHHYFLEPTTQVDLYQNMMSRNIIVSVDGKHYFGNGEQSFQQDDRVEVEIGLLYHRVKRQSDQIHFDITSFVVLDDFVELHQVILTNPTDETKTIKVTTSIPIYGRSADNLRDHRHVTSLLTKVETVSNGILNHPTLSFDERGHKQNDYLYSFFVDSNQLKVKGYIPILDDFIQGGSLHYPRGLDHLVGEGMILEGYEAFGGIQFEAIDLKPKESVTFYMSLGIHDKKELALRSKSYLNDSTFQTELQKVKTYFENYIKGLSFKLVDLETSNELSWVVLQPMLRRYLGNSYMPHHDYGRGGKGWRDLWQDLLQLIMMNDASVRDMLINNFQGVRIDGSNATIIGNEPGEFKADRNMITRVWSDHGAWPLLTVNMYIDETGDLDFLMVKQSYFQDQFTHYTKKTQIYHSPFVAKADGKPYEGTILEHLLLQNLVGYHNTGEHGFVRLEDADWNDGLDMGQERGETIAFTHMYADNLRKLARLIEVIDTNQINVFKELQLLLNQSIVLQEYFDAVCHFSGETIALEKARLISILDELANVRIRHLRDLAYQHQRFLSYYDNDGKNIDDENSMQLTGQAMALLAKTASIKQAQELSLTTKRLLFDASLGGYHLNTKYPHLLMSMGRAYGFAYGHKENGSIFSHMVMMYAYGLYQYNLVDLGREAWYTLIKRAKHQDSQVLAGIPEYFNDRGIGMYPYLTGSASWFLKLLRTEVFGIKLHLGKLTLEPKLKKEDFIDGKACITTYLFGKLTTFIYHNPKLLDYHMYHIHKIQVNGQEITQDMIPGGEIIEVHLDEIC